MGKKIVVIGGGMTGSSIAYHLAMRGASSDVVVIEPDPTYALAATPRSVGGVRASFGVRENVEMSLYGLDVFLNFSSLIDTGGAGIDAGYIRQGYAYIVAGKDALAGLEEMQAMHHSAGAPSELLDRVELARRWPSINFDDIDGALYSAIDGRVDPNACLSGFRKGAIAAGVEYLADKVVAIAHDDRSVSNVVLQSGEIIPASHVINATNCWAPEICAMAGMTIPVLPLCRETFFFDCQTRIEPIPVFRDANGFAIRPEGEGYLTGRTDRKKLGVFGWNVDYSRFDEDLWPLLAHRCSAFEAIKVKSGWAGNYDICTLDGNPIIGPWVDGLENFLVVAGFSGHGLQHGPAVGRGVAELLLDGGYQTIDLGRFSYRRVLENKPIVDLGPTA